MKKIPLNKGKFALVDDADFDELNRHKWRAVKIGEKYYVARLVLMHRAILNVEKSTYVDHANGNGLDNQRSNLRACTPAENARNCKRRCDNKSGFKGVIYRSNGKRIKRWEAYIQVDRKRICLGFFTTKEKAAVAYNKAALKYHGEFASLNPI